MKVTSKPKPQPLSRRVMRDIERELGVFFDKPERAFRNGKQQFGVYDEDEHHAGDVRANSRYFDAEELKTKVKALFNQEG